MAKQSWWPETPVADIVTHLGYPLYFLRIIGVWKLLGGIVLLIPGYPRLKEWAYAGIFFELSGAAASWWMHEHNLGQAVPPMVLAVVALVSWALRPQHRLLRILVPRFNSTPSGIKALITAKRKPRRCQLAKHPFYTQTVPCGRGGPC